MDLKTVIAILGGALSITAILVGAARFFSSNSNRIQQLTGEIETLKSQSDALRNALHSASPVSSTSTYESLAEVSGEAARAIRSEIHSISIPKPMHDPSHLQIIYSSDPEASKVVGREFPIDQGMAGWVYHNQKPYFQNRVASDKLHLKTVDAAAGTNYGQGAILTIPLTASGRCLGVAQFLKSQGGEFRDEDAVIAQRFSPAICRQLLDLQINSKEDIPSIARGSLIPVTILFSDISRFSDVVFDIPLEVNVTLLNEYYQRQLPFILQRGGKLQEYVGDGVYASFYLDSPATSAREAVSAAIEMQREFADILQSWKAFEHPVGDKNTHRIGVASGKVYSGLVGHTLERRERLIGSPINLAAHLCQETPRDGGVVVCSDTASLIGTDTFPLKPVTLPSGKHFQVSQSTS